MPNHPDIGNSMNSLAGVLKNLNRLEQSEKIYRETINFMKINLQPNHQDIGTSMDGLASVLLELNKL